MSTIQVIYKNFTTRYGSQQSEPFGFGPVPVSNPSGTVIIRFAQDLRVAIPGLGYPVGGNVKPYIYDPSDPSKYAKYNSTLFTTTNGTSASTAIFPAGSYTINLDPSAWTFNGGISSFTDGMALCFVSEQYNIYNPTPSAAGSTARLAPDGQFWCFCNEQLQLANIEYSDEVEVEKYANSIDNCPIFADRSTKDQNGDVIDTTYLKIVDMPEIPTAGRNMNLNQYGAMQTNLPGGLFDAPASQSNNFERLTGADFAGAFKLACRHNTSDNYELAIAYTASGTSSSYSFIGTETIVALDNSVTTKQAVYLGETCYYTPSTKFGGYASTAFDPTRHKAIIYDGIGQIGPTSDCKIAIYSDANSNVKIAFTAIEVGKVGSTT